MTLLLQKLSDTLGHAQTKEELVRPLLEMLQHVTRLESTYLTTIDFAKAVQHVLYARNSKEMQIPEGLDVPWDDTLCQRALNENRMCTEDVQSHWGDSQAAKALGIQTYASVPVRLSDGEVYGTLCAASAYRATLPEGTETVLKLFAQLIAQQIERERLMQQLQERNTMLTQLALTDALTQLPNRIALIDELQRLLARAARNDSQVLVAYVDLDGFKQINDQHGHAVGDRLLQAVAQQMQNSLRTGDTLARIGGDEMVMVTPGPTAQEDAVPVLRAVQKRLREASVVDVKLDANRTLHYCGASVGVISVGGDTTVDSALRLADEAMYADKQLRRSSPTASLS
ncbi:sensor domain-containing diguanylate cyclase [Comamonas kerstersii]|uniref:sensor domain-containing diguanylate cyclase n=1 Tax=Comamonas kerstersii TaxID=225992 RepID=UPI0026DB4CC9|nr:sensor domain-containing diguanylate cyclase [Comamonas kerstersii]